MTEYRYAIPMIFFPNVAPLGYDILSSLALAFKIHFGTQKLPTFTKGNLYFLLYVSANYCQGNIVLTTSVLNFG